MELIECKQPSVEIRRRVFQIERLAAMPQVLWRLVEALGDERTDARSLAKLIESDPGLTAKLLGLANSAYYGLSHKVTTIDRAVVVIGFHELQILALGAGLAELFDVDQSPPEMDGEGFWLHCLAVSWLAKELARAANYPTPAEVMVAGLLHDLGKLMLITHLSDEFAGIARMTSQGASYYQAEECQGLQHSILGYWLAKRWSLPDIHLWAIRDHHTLSEENPYLVTTCLVALADETAKSLGYGLAHKSRAMNQALALRATRLTREDLADVTMNAQVKVPVILDTWLEIL